MMLLDSNMIIYAALPEHGSVRTFIAEHAPAASAVSYVEILGYHGLTDAEQALLRTFFETAVLLPIDLAVLDRAVQLRQQRKMSMGDALIAATATVNRLTLVTHNLADFAWIEGLDLYDPLAAK